MPLRGFTLAEVLITLGIIGVVAALTIPTLLQTQKEKSTIAAVKKDTSLISNAIKMAIANEGKFSGTTTEDFYNYISPYFNVSKYCGTGAGCWTTDNIKYLHGQEWSDYNSSLYKNAILTDGSFLQVYYNPNANYGEFRIDVNGNKGPNTQGIDIFYFGTYLNDGNLALQAGNPEEHSDYEGIYACDKNSNISQNGHTCTGWILINDNMDYLHCSDLSWNGKTKCD